MKGLAAEGKLAEDDGEAQGLLSAVSNFWDTTPVSAYTYENDALGRRTARTDFNGSVATPNAFGYNHRSEVTSATMGANTYGYDYDAVGNRKTASESGASGLSTYSANALNQYTAISNGQSAISRHIECIEFAKGYCNVDAKCIEELDKVICFNL